MPGIVLGINNVEKKKKQRNKGTVLSQKIYILMWEPVNIYINISDIDEYEGEMKQGKSVQQKKIDIIRLDREGLMDKVKFEVQAEVNEGVSHGIAGGSMFRKRK